MSGEATTPGYEASRDALSARLFEVTDAIASLEWDNAELKTLHRALSHEMKREVSALRERTVPEPDLVSRTA